jgi:O-acetyl-ADP-ribose deacetylase (regulator of RNase III)
MKRREGDLLELALAGNFDVIVHGCNCQCTMGAGIAYSISFTVVNAYTQFHWHGPGVLADYDAIRSAMRLVKEQYPGKRIAYPRIGAGMAKGDWTLIAAIIKRALEGEDHTLVELPDP